MMGWRVFLIGFFYDRFGLDIRSCAPSMVGQTLN